MHRRVATGTAVGLLALTVVGLVTVGAVSVTTTDVAAQATNETNVTQHENPESVSEQGDSERLRGWLSDRLADRLRDSSIRISQGQYDAAEAAVGDEFEDRLSQYIDVAGETEGRGGTSQTDDQDDTTGADTQNEPDSTAEAFERAQNSQRELAAKTQEYRETYRTYRDAIERGDTETARLLARQLERLATEIRQLGGNTTQVLRSIETRTGEDTSNIQQRVTNVTQDITEQQAQVRTEAFVETRLEITPSRRTASFSEPVEMHGQLLTANGTAVANQSVQLQIGPESVESRTTANGTFTVSYRPVLAPAGTNNRTVRYLPDPTTPYLGTQTNVSIQIEQTSPTLTTAVRPSQARFGETVSITTLLVADGQHVSNVPISATLANQTVGRARTDDDGTARIAGTVPASVASGTVTIETSVALDGRAIGPATTTTTRQIDDTPTDLSVNATTTAEHVTVSGQLLASTGQQSRTGVASQPITVSVGEATRTTQTDANGRYEVRLPRTAVAKSGGSVQIRSSFDGSETNLDSASAETSLDLSGVSDGNADSESIPSVALVAVLAGVLIAAGVLLWYRRESDVEDSVPQDDPAVVTEPASGQQDDQRDRVLADAQDALAAGKTDRAVVSAYTAVRSHLEDAYDIAGAQTARELLARCETHLDGDARTSLSTLTEAYEQTVFASSDADGVGQRAVEAAQQLLADDDSGEVSRAD